MNKLQQSEHEMEVQAIADTEESEAGLANELLRDLADGKGWDEERWAKRGLQKKV
jgi:hypothetical protein